MASGSEAGKAVWELPDTDWEWVKRAKEMVDGDDHNMPEMGKYNGGQKLLFWVLVVSMAVLLISGVVITETVFNIPGIGRLVVDAIARRDYPIVQGVIMIFAGIYVLVNLLVDLSYTLFDPRIRY